jgi:hypothetical protein
MVDLLHSDTVYPAGSQVLEAGCGVGAQKESGLSTEPPSGMAHFATHSLKL